MFIALLAAAGAPCDAAATAGEEEPCCAEGEVLFENSCYYHWSMAHYTWPAAERECRRRGMRLASLHSQQEQDFVTGLIGGSSGESAWIGLTDAVAEGEYRWSDGSPLDYLNWCPGYPDGGDCVSASGSEGAWFDNPCDTIKLMVCRGASACGGGAEE